MRILRGIFAESKRPVVNVCQPVERFRLGAVRIADGLDPVAE